LKNNQKSLLEEILIGLLLEKLLQLKIKLNVDLAGPSQPLLLMNQHY